MMLRWTADDGYRMLLWADSVPYSIAICFDGGEYMPGLFNGGSIETIDNGLLEYAE